MKNKILEIFSTTNVPLTYKDICNKLGLDEDNQYLNSLINEMENDLLIIKTKSNKYISLDKSSYRCGLFKYDSIKKGRVVIDGNVYTCLDKDINGAIDNDKVLFKIYSSKNDKSSAKIVKVIDRDLDYIIGEVYKNKNNYYVKSLNKKTKNLKVKLPGVEVIGTKVKVALVKQLDNSKYIGEVSKRFNNKYDLNDDIVLELYKYGVNTEFSEQTLIDLENIPTTVLDSEKIGRVDLTKEKIFTIDCYNTKDIDDAISIKKLDNGNYLVGVHIADVSHYVLPCSSIDKDAYKRGTSIYLPNMTIPMLPKVLSNGICSLNPNEERLAISCLMELNENGNTVNYNIFRSVIKSNLKMTYDEVNNVLHNRMYDKSYKEYKDSLLNLNKLALILRKNRIKNGSLQFNNPELELIFDDNKVTDIRVNKKDLSEDLIEEFMIVANETVDKHLVSHGYSLLHRVHSAPSFDKMKDFFNLLNVVGCNCINYGYKDCCNNKNLLKNLKELIMSTGKLSTALSINLVKSLPFAKYSPFNIGHYGLSKDYYCHFTSPIRRYPDLVTHRILNKDLDNNCINYNLKQLEEIGTHSSEMERNSSKVENETFKLLLADFMKQYIGNTYNGIIIGVDDYGLSIQLDNYIEGHVKRNDLDGEYKFLKNECSLVSKDNKYTIGDYLKLRLDSISKDKKNINFKIEEKLSKKKYVKKL